MRRIKKKIDTVHPAASRILWVRRPRRGAAGVAACALRDLDIPDDSPQHIDCDIRCVDLAADFKRMKAEGAGG